ncbi:MAG: 2-C-methyl-D-erythritol 4-phosphate cytidylyltransferase [Blautia marasmi]
MECSSGGICKQFNITKLKRIVIGGATGQMSIYNGLKAIKKDYENTDDIVVVIHDGNRPMLPQDVITDNLVKQKRYGLAVTVIPTTEVVFVSKDGIESNAALNRDELWRTQTPHSYRFNELWEVHNQAIADNVTNMAASCSLMQKYGYTTYFSKGSKEY